MKKLFLFLACFIINIENVRADESLSAEVDTSQKIRQEVEKYKTECSKKAYPDDYMDHVYAFTDDSLKYANQKYHQCIKSIIIKKNKIIFPKKESEKMIQFLNELEKGILGFYWILHNTEDNGYIGRQQNDAVLGRFYEQILEDIILYEQNLQYN